MAARKTRKSTEEIPTDDTTNARSRKSSAASSARKSAVEKRAPGRRPKDKFEFPHDGVVKAPTNDADHALELLMDVPMNFKKVFGYLRKRKVENVVIVAEPSAFFIVVPTHEIVTGVSMHNVCSYFCAEPRRFLLGLENIDKMCAGITSEHHLLMLSRGKEDVGFSIHLRNCSINRQLHYTFFAEVSDAPDVDQLINKVALETLRQYSLNFKVPYSSFKGCFRDSARFTDKIIVEMDDEAGLQLHYEVDGVEYSESYTDPEKIDLVANGSTRVETLIAPFMPLCLCALSKEVSMYFDDKLTPIVKISVGDQFQMYTVCGQTEPATDCKCPPIVTGLGISIDDDEGDDFLGDDG